MASLLIVDEIGYLPVVPGEENQISPASGKADSIRRRPAPAINESLGNYAPLSRRLSGDGIMSKYADLKPVIGSVAHRSIPGLGGRALVSELLSLAQEANGVGLGPAARMLVDFAYEFLDDYSAAWPGCTSSR
jgi:hypothetical protein